MRGGMPVSEMTQPVSSIAITLCGFALRGEIRMGVAA
jgi:hypothetical protein